MIDRSISVGVFLGSWAPPYRYEKISLILYLSTINVNEFDISSILEEIRNEALGTRIRLAIVRVI